MTLRLEPAVGGLHRPRDEVGNPVEARYRLERMVGQGRMGTVWLAADEVLLRPVAVRLTGEGDARRLARFTDEARSAAGLWHPNLVQIYDFGMADGQAFLVMEYLPGGSLRERFRQSGVNADLLRRWACDLLSALSYLHSRGLRHGGVDAAHVQLDGDGRAHLSGFGTAAAGPAGSPVDDLFALGRLLAEAQCPRRDDRVLDELLDELLRSRSTSRPVAADQALEALRVCTDPPGQATQEFDVLSALAEDASAVAGRVAGGRRQPRWAPQRVLTAFGL